MTTIETLVALSEAIERHDELCRLWIALRAQLTSVGVEEGALLDEI